ncbi:FGGY family carbohydrate kinase [Polymorphobacter fuscus]|uniref:ATP:glycerol 3-phosphotransferase n=1 Tax=Sandarakinorhabdus fusca TaxID=1439888 RepID=A0A7C9GPD9_9SPHN|nr:FGGY family carbohydrate kinase [Polymorphobacter fuscus]KAB7646262.1 glycerol kinase [Polymorphobacter fuscus]MQT17477.1 glycerol kinase [Polymorphobacter fuscus]NJC09984.1 glycerol kinase [Polymorphobacter fuscus]
MSGPCVLAIDQGTTNTKALLVAPDGSVRLSRTRAMAVEHPRPGWCQQSATDIWDTVAALIAECVGAADGAEIAALAISNQRETIVVWDAETGRPIGPAIIWQCRRSADRCVALRGGGHEPDVVARSGLALDPLFPAGKIAWLLDSVPGARRRAEAGGLRCGTIDSWLLWNLTGGAVHATDHGNASRTQLFNLETLNWDAELAHLFDVPLQLLPVVMPSDSRFGSVAPGLTALPDNTPIHAMIGDSHAALFAHAAGGARAKVTIGTGSSLMIATAGRVRSLHGLSSTIAWSRGSSVQHALEGNIAVSGHAVAFAADLLGLADEAALTRLAASVDSSAGVVFVPALAGLGAPHWCTEARGVISGLSLGSRPAHIARATLEAVALQIGDVVAALDADLGMALADLSVDGGAARNSLLMQLLADLLDRSVVQPAIVEASALGAARLAFEALGMGLARHDDGQAKRFTPAISADQRQRVTSRWNDAVASARRDAAEHGAILRRERPEPVT